MEALLISKIKAAEVAGVCVRTIDNYIANGELKPRKIGKRTLIPVSELRKFVSRDHVSPCKVTEVPAQMEA